VVLAVDGRDVSSPRQLMRVLSSYEPGEALKLVVMRQKKRITLKGSLGR
jgi:S1-C subfamily serine protease